METYKQACAGNSVMIWTLRRSSVETLLPATFDGITGWRGGGIATGSRFTEEDCDRILNAQEFFSDIVRVQQSQRNTTQKLRRVTADLRADKTNESQIKQQSTLSHKRHKCFPHAMIIKLPVLLTCAPLRPRHPSRTVW